MSNETEEYTIIGDYLFSSFIDEVNSFLKNGWQLYGNPFSDREEHYCQAMVKYKADHTEEEFEAVREYQKKGLRFSKNLDGFCKAFKGDA